MENSYLKGQDLIKDIRSLPVIPEPRRMATPPLDPSGLSDTDDEDEDNEEEDGASSVGEDAESEAPSKSKPKAKVEHDHDDSSSSSTTSPPSHGLSLAVETKLLYRSVMKFASSPRVVDLSEMNRKRLEASQRMQQRERERSENSGGGASAGEGADASAGGDTDLGKGEDTGTSTGTGAGGVWMPRRKMPVQHVLERRMERERLARRVKGLVERANNLKVGV